MSTSESSILENCQFFPLTESLSSEKNDSLAIMIDYWVSFLKE